MEKIANTLALFHVYFFACILSVCVSTPTSALNWSDVQSKALSTAPDLQLAKANISSAEAAVDTAKASFYPTVSSSITAGRSVDSQLKRSANTYGAGVSLDQNIYSSGRDTAKLNAASSSRSAAFSEGKSTSVTLRAKLSRAWINALYLQELSKITLRNITRRESNEQIVRLRYSSGRENKGSVLKTEAQTLESKLSRVESVAKFALAEGALAILIGQPLVENEELAGQLMGDVVAPQKSNIPPVIAAKEAALRASEDSLALAKIQYLPTLGLSASAYKSASPNLPLLAPVYSAQLALNIPIFNAATSAGVRSAASKTAAATIELNAAKQAQEQAIKTKLSAHEIAKKRHEISRKNFEASALLGEISRKRYALGLGSFQDWNNNESELLQSEMDVLSSEKTVADALTDYHEQIGVTLGEVL